MKTSRTLIHAHIIMLLLCLPAFAQVQSQEVTHFSKSGLVFDYPAAMKIEDMSTEGGQHLVLVQEGSGAQIMVISRFDKISSQEQLATAKRAVADAFADTMMKELQKLDPKVTRTTAQIEVAGAQATGVRLRAVLNNEPGSAEVYSLLLGKRLVIVTLIGSDKEIAAAAPAWATIRSSLKIEEGTPAATAPKSSSLRPKVKKSAGPKITYSE
jgi:hypothetical protein